MHEVDVMLDLPERQKRFAPPHDLEEVRPFGAVDDADCQRIELGRELVELVLGDLQSTSHQTEVAVAFGSPDLDPIEAVEVLRRLDLAQRLVRHGVVGVVVSQGGRRQEPTPHLEDVILHLGVDDAGRGDTLVVLVVASFESASSLEAGRFEQLVPLVECRFDLVAVEQSGCRVGPVCMGDTEVFSQHVTVPPFNVRSAQHSWMGV